MRRIAAAAAALVFVAGAANAQGQGQGRNNDRGGGPSAEAGQRGGGGNAVRGDRGQGIDRPSMAQSMRASEQRGAGSGNANRNATSGERGAGNAERGNAERGNGIERQAERAVERVFGERGNGNRPAAAGPGDNRGAVVRVGDVASIVPRGLIDGCPPGLAKRSPRCVPPGQVRTNALRWDRPDFWGLARLGDGSYFYDDGYLVRYAPSGGILGYMPLLGGALSIGNAWPSYYEPVALPDYYERYYGLGPYQSYRYADDVVYRVDPETAAITSIAALLTGDRFAVGQPMPPGYDVYNVPPSYRDRYVDGPDALYRYSDGYIYQADPRTRLIGAAIELLAS